MSLDYGSRSLNGPPSDFYGKIKSLQMAEDNEGNDDLLLPGFPSDADGNLPYGPLLFIIYNLGLELGIKAKEIPSRLLVVTTATLDKAFEGGDEKGVARWRRCFKDHKLHQDVVLYGAGAVEAFAKRSYPIQYSRLGGDNCYVRTLPPGEFAYRSSNLACQATILQQTQKAFGLGLDECQFGSHYVHVLDGKKSPSPSTHGFGDNDWRCILFRCKAVCAGIHQNITDATEGKTNGSVVTEVIASIWDGGHLKHIVLHVRIGQGLLEEIKSSQFGMVLPEQPPSSGQQFKRGDHSTVNVKIDVVKVVCSSTPTTDQETLSKLKAFPDGNQDCVLHLLPYDSVDDELHFAHVTFMGQRNVHNKNPAVYEFGIDGKQGMNHPTEKFDRLSKELQELPLLLERECPCAFPSVPLLHNSKYVVNATFRILKTKKGVSHKSFVPIAIGFAPTVIPFPESPAHLHVEVARTLSRMIQRAGNA